jgi:hypothetical protein
VKNIFTDFLRIKNCVIQNMPGRFLGYRRVYHPEKIRIVFHTLKFKEDGAGGRKALHEFSADAFAVNLQNRHPGVHPFKYAGRQFRSFLDIFE